MNRRTTIPFTCLAVVLVGAAVAVAVAAAPPASQASLEIQFIGNMAVRLTDGATTLVSDFPYRSGYAGYMTWSLDGIAPVDQATAFITHEHADHWEPGLWESTGMRLIAPPTIAAGFDPGRVLPWEEEIRVGGAIVRPVRTPHTDAHHSYRVSWNGLELYFTGDTDSAEALLAQRELDVAFVSPWLLQIVADGGERIDTDLLVLYHHAEPVGTIPELGPTWVPRRGEVRRVDFPR